ncbi:MAG: DKNYY domain-containing protein [Saprospiraceae bacterium]|nr:DKNYY domain-containing protein [Saprospiraceae bacterium]
MQFSVTLLLLFALLLLGVLFSSCSTGYQKEGSTWVWVEYNENVGKKVTWIPEADGASFRVLRDKNYAADQQRVYLKGKVIPEADPASFEVLHKLGYARDKNRVFLDRERVLFADPGSFQVLDFPYARDAQRVFCGTLPIPDIEPAEVADFRATNTDALMAHMKSTVLGSHFIELYPEFQWLDSLGVSSVIVGDWGTGETPTKKFKGFKRIE